MAVAVVAGHQTTSPTPAGTNGKLAAFVSKKADEAVEKVRIIFCRALEPSPNPNDRSYKAIFFDTTKNTYGALYVNRQKLMKDVPADLSTKVQGLDLNHKKLYVLVHQAAVSIFKNLEKEESTPLQVMKIEVCNAILECEGLDSIDKSILLKYACYDVIK